MGRRTPRLPAALAAALALAAAGCQRESDPAPAEPAAARPAPRRAELSRPRNVVLVTMDTTRADALGPYGQELPATPNLDRLASRGTLFRSCVASAPSTLPSHASLFTGKHPFVHGARSNFGHVLVEEHETLAEVFAAHGYRTAAEVAAPVIGSHTGLAQGFDHYRDLEAEDVRRKRVQVAEGAGPRWITLPEREAADVTRFATRFIREHRREPFFLWLHYFDPHNPYSPPPDFFDRLPQSLYHAEILYVDDQIGEVVRQLERLGLRDRTLVVVTADHGESLGEHGEATHAFFVYDTTIRVPLIFSGAGIPEGRVVDDLVRLVDVAPTVLDWLGLPPLEAAQGVSLRPLLEGDGAEPGLVGYGESIEPHTVFGTAILRYVREGRWKYVHKVDPELFDLATDPDELRNVASEHPEIVRRLAARLREMVAEAPPAPADARAELDPEKLAQLEALGYVAAEPAAVPDDEIDLLALEGDDPYAKKDDVRAIAEGLGFVKAQRWEEAAERFRGVLERNPESAPTLEKLIDAVRRLDRPEELAALLERMIQLRPEEADAYVQLARLRFEAGRAGEAETLLAVALSLEPCADGPRATLAHLAAQRGDQARRIGLLREGVARCEASAGLRNNYAWALATSPDAAVRDGALALRLARRTAQGSGGDRGDYLDTLAAAHAEVGDFESAVRVAERAIAALDAAGADASQARAHLALFEQGRPIRDP